MSSTFYASKWSVLSARFKKKHPTRLIFTSDLLIVSDVVYVRYLVLIFFKVNGKRTTDLFDA